MPPSADGPWRNPYENRRLVTVRHDNRDLYELTISPGADVHDLVTVAATLPSVVYTAHRAAAPSDQTAILTFRAMPTGPDGAPVRPSPRAGGPGWVPTVGPATAGIPPTAYEQALQKILTTGAYQRHGPALVYGLAHCDPESVIAAADAIRAAWTTAATR